MPAKAVDPLGPWTPLPLTRAQRELVGRLGAGRPIFKLRPTLRLYDRSITISGDLVLAGGKDWGGTFIEGDLTVEGNLVISDRERAAVVVVMGNLHANGLVNLGANLFVQRALRCEGPVVHSPPHHWEAKALALHVWGPLHAQVVVGEVSTLGGSDSAVFATGFRPSGTPAELRFRTYARDPSGEPQRIAATFTPDVLRPGGLGLDVDRVMDSVRANRSIVLSTSTAPEAALIDQLAALDRETTDALDLHGRDLRQLPDELFELTALRDLNLSDNGLTQLDERVARLSELRRLDLADNQISRWAEIERIEQVVTEGACARHLEELSLDAARLTARVGRLKNLRRLRVEEARFPLPLALFGLPHLTELSLGPAEDHGRDNYLPPQLAKLRELESLELRHGMFREIPKALGKLTALRELALRCGFRTARFPRLNHLPLQSFTFSGRGFEDRRSNAPLLETIFDGIAGIPLRHLALPGWGRALDHRRASGKRVTRAAMGSFPDRFADLVELRTLDLAGNGLTSVPRSVFALPHLETLDVEDNELSAEYLVELKSRLPTVRIADARQR